MDLEPLRSLLRILQERDLCSDDLQRIAEAVDALRSTLLWGEDFAGLDSLADLATRRGINALEAASLALKEARLIQVRAVAGGHLP